MLEADVSERRQMLVRDEVQLSGLVVIILLPG